ncbi:MAG TPA: DNA methyltransferase [Candidatus Sumerlaeota bacterium]|nr:DNA methyltransferase [Candidatus Sumerlaeota bacterium]
MAQKPKPMTTTLWNFPSQQYGDESQGDKDYRGATPAYILWNLLQRYTKPKDLVVDPMAGSGTTLDVARELGRRALGYDLNVTRSDIFRCDARKLPLEDEKADFVFIDPPYSTHLSYSGDERCVGELDAQSGAYYQGMEQVIGEINRILRPGRHMALFVSDSFKKGQPFQPIGFELFALLRRHFEPVDIVAVVRNNRTLLRNHWHTAALEGNYYLRGFNYLFILKKPGGRPDAQRQNAIQGQMNLLAGENAPAHPVAEEARPRKPYETHAHRRTGGNPHAPRPDRIKEKKRGD